LQTAEGLRVGISVGAVAEVGLSGPSDLDFYSVPWGPAFPIDKANDPSTRAGIDGVFSGPQVTDSLDQLRATTPIWGECFVLE